MDSLGFVLNVKGPLVIKGKIPDFRHIKYPWLIEYDGYINHNPDSPRVREDPKIRDKKRDKLYVNEGYKILRLLPRDIRQGKKHTLNKIKNFFYN